MRMRSHPQRLVLSNRPAPLSESGGPRPQSGVPRRQSRGLRPARRRRIRRGLRTGALLSLIGLIRVARTARTRWQPVLRVLGALLVALGVVFGVMTPVTFVSGMLILGLAGSGRLPHNPEAALVRLSARPTRDT